MFLVGERAHKLKKPLVLPFVHYGTAARRRQMCFEKVRLNRRLAPSIYLGVRSIVPGSRGLELSDEDDPWALDHVVEMRRYDESVIADLPALLERAPTHPGGVSTAAVGWAHLPL